MSDKLTVEDLTTFSCRLKEAKPLVDQWDIYLNPTDWQELNHEVMKKFNSFADFTKSLAVEIQFWADEKVAKGKLDAINLKISKT